jgi:SAM-dependent methyltransferase
MAVVFVWNDVAERLRRRMTRLGKAAGKTAARSVRAMTGAAEKSHDQRVAEQIQQYADNDDMHGDLSATYNYWTQKFLVPRLQAVTGHYNHLDVYAKTFIDRIKRTGNPNIASVGSGDGSLEVLIGQVMERYGHSDFHFTLLELSPIQNERARRNAAAAGLGDRFTTLDVDLNAWRADKRYSSVMAHHSLHHMQDLEHLFDAIRDAMEEDGCFVTFDMIGRNGHMRWPEAYRVVNSIWAFLPPEKRRHIQLNKVYDEFYNHDCSTEGFEGIRAQDILPCLVKTFHFEAFLSWGNIIDPFVDRGYGANYDIRKKEDAAFIDFLEEMNEVLIEAGHIKPTQVVAIMTKTPVAEPKLWKGRTPESMIRVPD